VGMICAKADISIDIGRLIIFYYTDTFYRMWNWKAYPSEEINSAKNPYITYHRQSDPRSLDHPSSYSMFDVKKQYTTIK